MQTKPSLLNLDITDNNILDDIPVSFIEERLENISAINSEIISDIHLSALVDIHGDFTKRICFKTGQMLAPLDRVHISHALKIMGEDFGIKLLQRENIAHCAIHWIKTDNDGLDKLCEIDPIGYFVYASGYVLNNHSPLAEVNNRYHLIKKPDEKNVAYDAYNYAAFSWALEKYYAYQALSNTQLTTIIRVNEELRRYLAVFQATNIDDMKLDSFAELLTIGEIDYRGIIEAAAINIEVFEQKLRYILKKVILIETAREDQKFDMDAKNYSKILQLKEKYAGHTNFRLQLRFKGQTESEILSNIVNDILTEANISRETIRHMEHQRMVSHKGKLVLLNDGETIATVAKGGTKMTFNIKVKPKD